MRDLHLMVNARFNAATETLNSAGATLSDETIPMWDDVARVQAKASFSSIEAVSFPFGNGGDSCRGLRSDRGCPHRPRTNVSASDYIAMQRERTPAPGARDGCAAGRSHELTLRRLYNRRPKIYKVSTIETFLPKNFLNLRNTSLINFFDLCAISLPLPRAGELPFGLDDRRQKRPGPEFFRSPPRSKALRRLATIFLS